MSGGVDSSVAAALLKREGHSVVGVFMRTWSPEWLPCTWPEDRREAMRAAAHLGIPFLTFDFEREYKDEVVQYMIDEYQRGRTPNPDVLCNTSIKFGHFLREARRRGADYIATGHYAQNKKMRGLYSLHRGADPDKDQSYFLWGLSQAELAYALFPVGGFVKKRVRELAREFTLPNAARKDSQGLCFIGKLDMEEFLSHYIEKKVGVVTLEDGTIIGEHSGIFFYTIGQRHGFMITKKTPSDTALYVVAKKISENILVVSPRKPDDESGQMTVPLERIHWISTQANVDEKIVAQVRYRQSPQNAIILNTSVQFESPQTAASGQSVVFYRGNECLGGGVIA